MSLTAASHLWCWKIFGIDLHTERATTVEGWNVKLVLQGMLACNNQISLSVVSDVIH